MVSLPLSSWQPLSHTHHGEAPRLHFRPCFQSLFGLSCAVQLRTVAFKRGHDFLLFVQEKAGFERDHTFFASRTRRHKMHAFRRIKAQFSSSEPSSTHPSRPDTFFQNESKAGFWAAPPILADLMLAVKLNMDLSPSRLVLLACQYKLQPGTFNRSRVFSPARPIIDRHSVSRLNPARRMLKRRI